MDWKVGQDCFVVIDKTYPAKVTKVGRKLVTVKTVESEHEYTFDVSGEHPLYKGTTYGYQKNLLTVEQVQLRDAHNKVVRAVHALEKHLTNLSGRQSLDLAELTRIRDTLLPLIPEALWADFKLDQS